MISGPKRGLEKNCMGRGQDSRIAGYIRADIATTRPIGPVGWFGDKKENLSASQLIIAIGITLCSPKA